MTQRTEWTQCRECGKTGVNFDPLYYIRHDGVPGMSYAICPECQPEQIHRLERLGFTMVDIKPTGVL